MTNKEPTQHQKSLAIAKAMYGEENVHDCCDFDGNCSIEVDSLPFEKFDPYINAWHSQAVQEFFNINVECHGNVKEWECSADLDNAPSEHIYNKDLKTAIADCAYLVVLENEK